jgi:signal transduction histidine kinase
MEVRGLNEVKDILRNFNTMTEELSAIEGLRRDFVNHVSHEFKTPITSISGFAELMSDPQLDENLRREYLSVIVLESKRLASLATNVLNLSKYEAQTIVTDKKSYALDEQIRRAVLLLEPKWSAKKLDVVLDLEAVEITSNADLMQEIWINLMDNAIKFSPAGGLVAVKLFSAGTRTSVEITDEGPGMDAETLLHIFEKFYQGDVSHSQQGHGLGLALVKRITELLGGTVTADSRPGEGSTFRVTLPG